MIHLLKVNKEISMNLLENLLTLYLGVRSSSRAKDKVEQHNITLKKNRQRSLRTGLKKSTSNFDQGH